MKAWQEGKPFGGAPRRGPALDTLERGAQLGVKE